MKLTKEKLKQLIKEELNEMMPPGAPKYNQMDMTLDNMGHSALDELKNDKEALAALAMELNLTPGQLEMAVRSVLAGRGK
tara:strand:+ start:786 stop:1025 length:240 start_codon:yes stop_codon:yes gene_type:complete